MPEAGVEPPPAKPGGSVRLIALGQESPEARKRYLKMEIGNSRRCMASITLANISRNR